MSTRIILDNTALVYEFVRKFTPVGLSAGMQGIGLERDGRLVAGVLYDGFNGVNCWMHVAAEPGAKWLNRAYLRTCFAYPFLQLQLKRVSGYVEASNLAARKFDEHLGFRREAVLRGAASDGGDVFLYVMRRENCRYV